MKNMACAAAKMAPGNAAIPPAPGIKLKAAVASPARRADGIRGAGDTSISRDVVVSAPMVFGIFCGENVR